MTNDEVEKGFNEVYNDFWNRYKNRVPGRDSPEWEKMYTYAVVLQKKYLFLADTVTKMIIELDDRMRGGNHD